MADWDEFVTNVNEDGRARSYMFEWQAVPIPDFLLGKNLNPNENLKLMSTSIPGSEIEEISAYWYGVQYKLGGTRRFNDWNVTVMCDNSAFVKNLRMLFELWMGGIAGILATGLPFVPEFINYKTDPKYYYVPQQLYMLDDAGNRTQGVYIASSWPKSISDISLDRSSTDFAQFDVTFACNSATFVAV